MTREPLAPALAGLLLLLGLVYWPGLSGPWLFDDFSNIHGNAFLRVTALDWQSLGAAAGSLEAGPLGRPLAYFSFALNHYLHGDASPYAWKATNLAIHGVNALLMAALLMTVLLRLAQRGALPARMVPGAALALAALWALHPIQISSVLYVVQRMTSLSGTFTLAALLCWLQARERIFVGAGHARDRDAVPGHDDAHLPAAAVAGMARSYSIGVAGWLAPLGWLLAGVAFALLGAFTKETAVLLPLYALALDRVLYPDAPYWQRWLRLPAGLRLALLVAALAVVFGLAAWHYAPGYAGRPFTLTERVLTQARVLWFYIGLVALPRINAFGLHHDDIAISSGLLAPWTTLPAVLGLAGLALLGWRYLDRRPLVGLGLLWFLAGHVLESTVVPLEIAHEHRNYLPLLGLLLAGAGVLLPVVEHWQRRATVALLGTLGAVLAGTTALRADQWGNELGMSRYEVRHHPNSAQARNNLAADLVWRGHYAEAREQLEAAIELAPWEVGYPMNLVGAYRVDKLEPPDALATEILRRIREEPLSAFGSSTLHRYSECLGQGCRYLLADVVGWLEAYRDSGRPTFDRSYIEYLLGIGYREQGRIQDALNAFQRAHDLDPKYLHPLFAQANILLSLRQWDTAALVLDSIRAANEDAYQRLDRQIAELDAAIAKGRGGN
ncbi:tetratricopeptide repeat protein [Immundisolibacter cernigliae]|nr:tetratricopeptide repeat protein [Immundisolibacter cernigliae]